MTNRPPISGLNMLETRASIGFQADIPLGVNLRMGCYV